jgi:hypothetical protein
MKNLLINIWTILFLTLIVLMMFYLWSHVKW